MPTEKIFSFNLKELTFTRRITKQPQEARFPRHSHPQIEIVVARSEGHGYSVDGQEIALSPYELIMIAPSVPHRVMVGEGDYDRFSVIIHPALLPDGRVDALNRSMIKLRLSRDDEIYKLLKKAERYAKELPESAKTQIFPALALEIYFMILSRLPSEKPTPSDIVNRAIEYMDTHFAEIKHVSQVYESLYVSKSYFHSLFSRYMNKTPLAYLNERRLYCAHTRIAAGAKPSAIYRECGFDDYTSFFRAYKRLYGHAPSNRDGDEDGFHGF